MRPSTADPTGTMIGAPVIRALMRRDNPCVGCIAMARKRRASICDCTSQITARPSGSTITASLTEGKPTSLESSTTGPRTAVTRARSSGKVASCHRLRGGSCLVDYGPSSALGEVSTAMWPPNGRLVPGSLCRRSEPRRDSLGAYPQIAKSAAFCRPKRSGGRPARLKPDSVDDALPEALEWSRSSTFVRG